MMCWWKGLTGKDPILFIQGLLQGIIYNPYTRRYATIYYPSQFMGYERDERPSREGTVTISMIDAKTDKTVWQGWTTDEVNSKNFSSKEIQNSCTDRFSENSI